MIQRLDAHVGFGIVLGVLLVRTLTGVATLAGIVLLDSMHMPNHGYGPLLHAMTNLIPDCAAVLLLAALLRRIRVALLLAAIYFGFYVAVGLGFAIYLPLFAPWHLDGAMFVGLLTHLAVGICALLLLRRDDVRAYYYSGTLKA